MPFWSENYGENANKKDPKRNFRFIVEFFRVPDEQLGYLILSLSMGQIISLIFIIFGIILFYVKNENKQIN